MNSTSPNGRREMSTTAAGVIAPDFQSWSKSVPPARNAVPGFDA
jgi:hypothetical protein